MNYSCTIRMILSVLCITLFAQSSGLAISNWEAVESELNSIDLPATIDDYLKLPDLNQLYASNDPAIYWEMVAQEDSPLVQLAGFSFLKARSMDSAMDAAVRLIYAPGFPIMLDAPLMVYLSEPPQVKRLLISLDRYIRIEPNETTRRALILSVLPEEQLEQWYLSHQNPEISASFQAVVLDEILSKGSNHLPISRVRNDLNRYRLLPGTPRTVFVLNAEESTDGYRDAVVEVLQDKSPDNIDQALVAVRKRDYILKNIKWKELKLSNSVYKILADKEPQTQPEYNAKPK